MVTSLSYIRRCLTLTLLLLSFASTAWGDEFIHYGISGTSNDWQDAQLVYNSTSTGTVGTVTIPLEAGKTYEFLLKQTPDKW